MLPSSGEWRVDTPSCCSRTYARTHAHARARAHYSAHARTHAKMIFLFCNEGLRICFPPLESGSSTLLLVAHTHTHARTHAHVHARTIANMHVRMQKLFVNFVTRVFARTRTCTRVLWRTCTHACKHDFSICNEGLRTCFPPLESGASTLLPIAHAHNARTHARTRTGTLI
jgi:hypothetical protein